MDRLGNFAVFVQVAETRSFVATGRILGISASAVGKSISRLEQSLGARLFHRSTRSVALTVEGEMFLERCRRILAEFDSAEQELAQASAAPRGRLRVSLPMVSPLMLPVLAQFMVAYPDIELDLDFSDRLVDVIDEGFDAVIRTGEPSDSRLSARRLGMFRLLLVASPAYLAQRGTPRVPTDLLEHACLHYRFPSSGKLETWVLRREDGEAELQLPVAMICNNIETRVCFALRGLGIAYLPDFAIREELAAGTLQPVLQEYVLHTNVFHVLWPGSRHPSPKVRALVDYLCAHVFPQPSTPV